MAKIYYESELTHHGTKGMKWGKRLYQNKDGSLTPLGRIRYGVQQSKRKRNLKKARAAKAEKKRQAELEAAKPKKPKSAKEMSEAELRAAIEHLKLEKEFQQRYNELNPPAVNKGKELVNKLAKEVVAPMAKDAATELVKNVAVPYLKKQLGIDDSAADGAKKVAEKIKLETDKAKMQIEKAKAEKEIIEAKKAKELHDDFMADREKKRQKVAEREAQEKANKEAKEKAEQEARSKTNEKVKAAKESEAQNEKAESSDNKTRGATGVRGMKWGKTEHETWGENLDDWMDAPKTKKQTSEGSSWTKKNRETFDAEWSEVSDSDVSSGEQFALALLNDKFSHSDTLTHHGIKGQKWGVRRYQNKDGSLTDAGRKRLAEKAGWYMNPGDKHSSARKAVAEEYVKNTRYTNEHIFGYRDDYALHDDRLWNSLVDKYAKATLEDLGYSNSKEAVDFVKGLFKKDLIPQSVMDETERRVANDKKREQERGTMFDKLKPEFTVTSKNGDVSYVYATKADIDVTHGLTKKVSVNMRVKDSDITTSSAKEKTLKAQKFIDDYDDSWVRYLVSKDNPNVSEHNIDALMSLDLDVDRNKATATYTTSNSDLPYVSTTMDIDPYKDK